MAVMEKRGSMLVFIAIVTLVVALFAALIYPQIAQAYASGKVALKAAAARDIALVLDAIYAYPYDMELKYDVDLSDFTVEISANKVEVYDSSEDDADTDFTAAEYSFVQTYDGYLDFSPSIKLIQPQKIIFRKEGGKVTATK